MEKKEKDLTVLVNPLLQYKFWFKVFGAVLLIIFGVLALINPIIQQHQ